MSSAPHGHQSRPADRRLALSRRDLLVAAGLGLASGVPRFAAAASPDQLTWGIHVSLAPTWFEPAEASGIITPFMVLYALHDAMVKPTSENPASPEFLSFPTRRRTRTLP